MGLADRLREAAKKAEDAASEHKDELRDALDRAGAAADQRTGGRYREQIDRARARAGGMVERIKDPEDGAAGGGGAAGGAEAPGEGAAGDPTSGQAEEAGPA